METSLRFNNTQRKMFLHAKEKFASDDDVVLTISGSLCPSDSTVQGRFAVKKQFFPQFVTRIDAGAVYTTDLDEVHYCFAARKSIDISDDGLLSLGLKGNYSFHAQGKPHKGVGEGQIELTKKIFNFTEDQDLRLKVGYSIRDKLAYGQIRENNWTLNVDQKGRWGVKYDL